MQRAIQSSIDVKKPVAIRDLCEQVFGHERTGRVLDEQLPDADIEAFIEDIYPLVDAGWATRGVTADIGPYLEKKSTSKKNDKR